MKLVVPEEASLWAASYEEGSTKGFFEDSKIILQSRGATPAGNYTVVVDTINRLKRTCTDNATFSIAVQTPFIDANLPESTGLVGFMSNSENSSRSCFLYYNSVEFSDPHQQLTTGINVTLHLPFHIAQDTAVTVKLPGFTNKIGWWPLSPSYIYGQTRGVLGMFNIDRD
jgi:hypothetical protein